MSGLGGQLHFRAAAREDGRTTIAAQSFRAPFHLSKPYWDQDSRVLLTQVVNPTAGILAGDTLESEVVVETGAAVLMTTPSASRVFRMREGQATGRQQFSVLRNGWLEVMAEPLVPHRGSRYRQATNIEVATGGGLYFVDQLMPGRLAHGDAWQWDRLVLDLTVSRGGELLLRERLDQTGIELRALAALNGAGDQACFANGVIMVPGDDEHEMEWQRALIALHGDGIWLGLSSLGRGSWSLRLVARDPLRMRAALRAVRSLLAVQLPRLACDPRKL
jgi:urease accessory protein